MKFINASRITISLSLCGALVACYVVPVQPATPQRAMVMAPVAPVPVSFPARLYPANDKAAVYGVVSGVITSDLNGRGHFSATLGGEYFQGEATRTSGTLKGVANAIGNRGNYLNCQYQMNNSSMGSGQCQHTDGSQLTLHIGQ